MLPVDRGRRLSTTTCSSPAPTRSPASRSGCCTRRTASCSACRAVTVSAAPRYYTPEVLTRCVVRHALAELLGLDDYADPNGSSGITVGRRAVGSDDLRAGVGFGGVPQRGHQPAVGRVPEAAARPSSTRPSTPTATARELQKVKAHFALHQTYGVDLNATAVELAEVSLWLNAMYPGLKAPWFGLQLRQGNSLIGCRRATWRADQLANRPWAQTKKSSLQAPTDRRCSTGHGRWPSGALLADDEIHHFLLPGHGWAAVADRKEAKELRPDEVEALKEWRKAVLAAPDEDRRQAPDRPGRRGGGPVAGRGGTDPLHPAGPPPSHRRLRARSGHRRRRATAAVAAPMSRRQAQEILVRPELAARSAPHGDGRLDRACGSGPSTRGRRRRAGTSGWPWSRSWSAPTSATASPASSTCSTTWPALLEAERASPAGHGRPSTSCAAAHPWLVGGRRCRPEPREPGTGNSSSPRCSPHGGFDLQVGNPPWVRPSWQDDLVLAEHDPWWGVTDKPAAKVIKDRRAVNLSEPGAPGRLPRRAGQRRRHRRTSSAHRSCARCSRASRPTSTWSSWTPSGATSTREAPPASSTPKATSPTPKPAPSVEPPTATSAVTGSL